MLATSQIQVFSDVEATYPMTAVAGDGVFLLVYQDNSDYYQFRLMDNERNILWTKQFDELVKNTIDNNYEIIIDKVLYDIDNTFAIFFGKRLIKISPDGEIVLDQPNFLNYISEVCDIQLASDGNYIVCGNNGQRAVFSIYSREGELILNKLYFVHLPEKNSFTSFRETVDGGYIVGGCNESITPGLDCSIFFVKYSSVGGVEWTKRYYVDPPTIGSSSENGENSFGKEIILNADGSFKYIFNTGNSISVNQTGRIIQLNLEGDSINTETLQKGRSNFCAGTDKDRNVFARFNSPMQGIGRGSIQLQDGKVIGVVNEKRTNDNLSQLNFNISEHAYTYVLNSQNQIISTDFIDTNFAINISDITQLSDNSIVLFGSILGFENKLELILISYTL